MHTQTESVKIVLLELLKIVYNNRSKIIEVGKLVKQNKQARKLSSGSVYSSNTWGHEATDLAMSRLDKLEKDGALSSGINAAGRCRFWALVVAYGPRGHPITRIIRDIFIEWFKVLRHIEDPVVFEQIAKACHVTKIKLCGNHNIQISAKQCTMSLRGFSGLGGNHTLCIVGLTLIKTTVSSKHLTFQAVYLLIH